MQQYNTKKGYFLKQPFIIRHNHKKMPVCLINVINVIVGIITNIN